MKQLAGYSTVQQQRSSKGGRQSTFIVHNKTSNKDAENMFMSGHKGDTNMDDVSLRSMLNDMISIISRLHMIEKEAYLEACRQNPEYANSDRLKIRFLRVENYNTGLAVHRMCQYFDFKLHWFGHELLAKPIELSDLGPNDLAILSRGDLQMLKQCHDDEGRKIAHYCCRRHDTTTNSTTNINRSSRDDDPSTSTKDNNAIQYQAVSTCRHQQQRQQNTAACCKCLFAHSPLFCSLLLPHCSRWFLLVSPSHLLFLRRCGC